MENISARHNLPSPVSVTSLYAIYRTNIYRSKPLTKFSYPFTELTYIAESPSPYSVVLDDTTYTLNAGQLLFFPPGSEHHLPKRSSSIVCMITFDVDFPEINKLYGRILTLNGRQKLQLEQVVSTGIRLLENIPEKGYTVGTTLSSRANAFELQKFKNLFELFLVDLYLKETSPINSAVYRFRDEEKLENLITYLKKNIDKPLTLKELSEKSLISVAKIRKLFYEKHTCAPMQYFNQLKLEAAIELMCNTPLSYAEISDRLGFSSPAYFSRLFKKKMGMPPSEYIKSLKNSK
ncbi:MAG: helix-turn-helix domain-containing protein [Ruminococcaceae bacterium]|nr:helix-turn-helix domain-containing protein [Oscillospiraceae bacterium]